MIGGLQLVSLILNPLSSKDCQSLMLFDIFWLDFAYLNGLLMETTKYNVVFKQANLYWIFVGKERT